MSDLQHHLAALLTRIAAGDRQAFADFFDATYPTVSTWVHGGVTATDRADLLTAAYLHVWTRAPSFPLSTQSVTQWLAATTAPALATGPHTQPPEHPRRPRLRLPALTHHRIKLWHPEDVSPSRIPNAARVTTPSTARPAPGSTERAR